MATVQLGQAFGQQVSLCARLREILRNYPEGLSIFYELLQNADDAGATEVVFCVDCRTLPTAALAFPGTAPYHGPALLASNNRAFTETDLQSIQRVGDSLKREESSGFKTGRFGLGFNSVFHLTDVPSFATGSKLVWFDPSLACSMPGVDGGNPGKMVDWIEQGDVLRSFADQCLPYRLFGCTLRDRLEGALFRFPLRTAAQAATSQISSRAHTAQEMLAVLHDLAKVADETLVFLRNVHKITLCQIAEGDAAPTLISTCAISNMDQRLAEQRSLAFLRHSNLKSAAQAQQVEYCVSVRTQAAGGVGDRQADWAICQKYGSAGTFQLAQHPDVRHLKLLPYAGVAARITDGSADPVHGRAYVFLPTPIRTGLPIMVNGYFELSSNRRDLWWAGEEQVGEGRLRAEWNKLLLTEVAAGAYARLLSLLASSKIIQERPWSVTELYPVLADGQQGPWHALAKEVLAQASTLPVLPVRKPSAALQLAMGMHEPVIGKEGWAWVQPKDAYYLDSPKEGQQGLAKQQYAVEAALLSSMQPVAQVPVLLARALVATRIGRGMVTPAVLRGVLKVAPGGKTAVLAGLELTLLSYALYDLMAPNVRPEAWNDILGLPLLPLANGKFLVFLGRGTTPEASIVAIAPDEDARQLLSSMAGHVLAPPSILGESLYTALSSEAVHRVCQLTPLTPALVGTWMRRVLPSQWSQAGVGVATEQHIATLRLLWRYLSVHAGSNLAAFVSSAGACPVLPVYGDATQGGIQVRPLHPVPQSPVISSYGLSSALMDALVAVGVPVSRLAGLVENAPSAQADVDPASVHPQLSQYMQPPTPQGLGQVLLVHKGLQRQAVSADQCSKLCAWVLTWAGGPTSACPAPIAAALRSLAIYQLHGSTSMSCLQADPSHAVHAVVAPVPGMPGQALQGFIDLSGVDVPTDTQLRAYHNIGAPVLAMAEWYRGTLIPRLGSLGLVERCTAVACILRDMPSLSRSSPEFVSALSQSPFLPTATGAFIKPIDCYDPSVPLLEELLGAHHFPSPLLWQQDSIDVTQDSILSTLRSLGMRGSMSREAVLTAAKGIEEASKTSVQDEAADHARQTLLRAIRLLNYVDAHAADLLDGQYPSTPATRAQQSHASTGAQHAGLFGKVGGLFKAVASAASSQHKESATERQAAEMARAVDAADAADFVEKLQALAWVPAWVRAPVPQLPWPVPANASASACVSSLPVTCKPGECRPLSDAWLVSMSAPTLRLLCLDAGAAESIASSAESYKTPHAAAEPRLSSRMEAFFGWTSRTLDAKVALRQWKALASASATAATVPEKQAIHSAVLQIYASINTAVTDPEQSTRWAGAVSSYLRDVPSVWLGPQAGTFVHASKVAFQAPAEAKPYLHAVPTDMLVFSALLRALGVREAFSRHDYAAVLQALFTQHSISGPEGTTSQSKLSSEELQLALSMLQRFAQSIDGTLAAAQSASDLPVYLPDKESKLCLASTLVFDDAPWLSAGRDAGDGNVVLPSLSASAIQYTHPLLSNAVAAAAGATSLRETLLLQSGLTSLDVPAESFGQSEPLTRRLRHILEQYAEGPGALYEMLQNADDAGASQVSVLLDLCTYGTEKLLSPKMAPLQGPSLCVYNDGVFTEADFKNLARLGQGSKMEKLNSTGRYGLGFNACYHLTDVPMIVSADSLVLFDPHCQYVPAATSAQPGIRIRFAGDRPGFRPGALLSQFPDQFAPLLHFGNSMTGAFAGTLFRFPLRSAASEIKATPVTQDAALELLEAFRSAASQCLIFLRHVSRVQVFVRRPSHIVNGPADTQLLYEVIAAGRGSGGASATAPTADMEVQLASRCAADLPGSNGGVCEYLQQLAHDSLSKWRRVPTFLAETGQVASSSTTQVLSRLGSVSNKDAFYAAFASVNAATLPKDTLPIRIIQVEYQYREKEVRYVSSAHTYLVHTRLGGGRARAMACDAANRELKLIPWAGVAARLATRKRRSEWVPSQTLLPDVARGASVGLSLDRAEDGRAVEVLNSLEPGKAFVFLPLPVAAGGLPAHINGYFEISSNRRDLWTGTDMSGKGKVRSMWNSLLLADVVAPCYGRLLFDVGRVLSHGVLLKEGEDGMASPVPSVLQLSEDVLSRYYALWPSTTPPEPWQIVVSRLFELAWAVPLLYSTADAAVVRQWNTATSKLIRAGNGRHLLPEGLPAVQLAPVGCGSWCAPRDVVLSICPSLDKHVPQAVGGTSTSALPSLPAVLPADDVQIGSTAVSMSDFLGGSARTTQGAVTRTSAVSSAPAVPTQNEASVGPTLTKALNMLGVPQASLPTSLYWLLASVSQEQLHVTPAFVRSLLRLQDAAIQQYMAWQRVEATRATAKESLLRTFPALDSDDLRHSLLAYCLGQLQPTPSSFAQLHGLPLLPLIDGGIGIIRRAVATSTDPFVFIVHNRAQETLLQPLAWRCVSIDRLVQQGDETVAALLTSEAAQQGLAIRSLGGQHAKAKVHDILAAVMPLSWSGRRSVAWEPVEQAHTGLGVDQPSAEWVTQLWSFLATVNLQKEGVAAWGPSPGSSAVPAVDALYPFLPVVRFIPDDNQLLRRQRFLLQLHTDAPIIQTGAIPQTVLQALVSCGVFCLDDAVLGPSVPQELFAHRCVHPPTGRGAILAILSSLTTLAGHLAADGLPDVATGLDEADAGLSQACLHLESMLSTCSTASRQSLLQFLADSLQPAHGPGAMWKWRTGEPVTAMEVFAMRCLPIHELHGDVATDETPDTFRPLLGAVYLAPSSVPGSALGANFVRASTSAQAALAACLGAEVITEEVIWVEHVLPALARYAPKRRDAAVAALLSRVPLVDAAGRGRARGTPVFSTLLRDISFVPTSSNVLKKPIELYDPSVPALMDLMGEEDFPCAQADKPLNADSTERAVGPSLRTPEILQGLRKVGLQTSLSPSAVLMAAERIQADNVRWSHAVFNRSVGEETDALRDSIKRRASNLLKLLDTSDSCAQSLLQEAATVEVLASTAWMPVLTAVNDVLPSLVCPPVLPLPPGVALPGTRQFLSSTQLLTLVLPPARVRPVSSAWQVSGCMGMLEGSFTRTELLAKLGWVADGNGALPAVGHAELAKQIVALSMKHSSTAGGRNQEADTRARSFSSLTLSVPQLYTQLAKQLGYEVPSAAAEQHDTTRAPSSVASAAGPASIDAQEAVSRILAGRPWVFTGDDFLPAQQVALRCPSGSKPYLAAPYPGLLPLASMLRALGVQEEFGVTDLLRALKALPTANPLPQEQLDFALALVNTLGGSDADVASAGAQGSAAARGSLAWLSALGRAGPLPVPDAVGRLRPAPELVLNDAQWLATSTGQDWENRLAHPSVHAAAARTLGVQSLRALVLGSQGSSSKLPCAGHTAIKALLSLYADAHSTLFRDVMELADVLGADGMVMMWDSATYPTTALINPALAAVQGPACTFALLGCKLTTEQVLPCCDPALRLPTRPATPGVVHRPLLSGPGMLSCFSVCDILQVLTNGSLYVVDPARITEESTSRVGADTAGVCGVYSLSSGPGGIMDRFSDQFAPFLAARAALSTITGRPLSDLTRCDVTYVRVPMRKEASSVGEFVLHGAVDLPSPSAFNVTAPADIVQLYTQADCAATPVVSHAGGGGPALTSAAPVQGLSVADLEPIRMVGGASSALLHQWSSLVPTALPCCSALDLLSIVHLPASRGQQPTAVMTAYVHNGQAQRQARQKLHHDTEWQRFKFSSLFKSFNAQHNNMVLDIVVTGTCALPLPADSVGASRPPVPHLEDDAALVHKALSLASGAAPAVNKLADVDADGFPLVRKPQPTEVSEPAAGETMVVRASSEAAASDARLQPFQARYMERWSVHQILGTAAIRDLALTTPGLEGLQVQPLVQVAAPVLRVFGNKVTAAAALPGCFSSFGGVLPACRSGLPALLTCPLLIDPLSRTPVLQPLQGGLMQGAVTRAALHPALIISQQSNGVASVIRWNEALISSCLRDGYTPFLTLAREIAMGKVAPPGGQPFVVPSSQLPALYDLFAAKSRLSDPIKHLWPTSLWPTLAEAELWVSQRHGQGQQRAALVFAPLSSGQVAPSAMSKDVIEFIAQNTSATVLPLPPWLADEVASPLSGIRPPPHGLTPGLLRTTLLPRCSALVEGRVSPTLASQLLAYCLTDVYASLHQAVGDVPRGAQAQADMLREALAPLVGLALLPLANGQLGKVGGLLAHPGQILSGVRTSEEEGQQQYLLSPSPRGQALLPHMTHRFIGLAEGDGQRQENGAQSSVWGAGDIASRRRAAYCAREYSLRFPALPQWTNSSAAPRQAPVTLASLLQDQAVRASLGVGVLSAVHIVAGMTDPSCPIRCPSWPASLTSPACIAWTGLGTEGTALPPPSWMAALWREFDALSGETFATFGHAPLLPLLPGPVVTPSGPAIAPRLLSCSLATHALYTWEGCVDEDRAQTLEQASANWQQEPGRLPTGQSTDQVSAASRIHALLQRTGVPLLDVAVLPTRPPKIAANGIAPCTLQSLSAVRVSVAWTLVSSDDKTALLRLFSSHMKRHGVWTEEELATMRGLPLFETAQGQYVSLEGAGAAFVMGDNSALLPAPAAPSSTVVLLDQDDQPFLGQGAAPRNVAGSGVLGNPAVAAVIAQSRLQTSSQENGSDDKFLKSKPDLQELYTALGVKPLSEGQVVARYVIPPTATLPGEQAMAVLQVLSQHWSQLKQEPDVVKSLAETAWLPVRPDVSGRSGTGSRVKPRDAVHPQHALLTTVAAVVAAQAASDTVPDPLVFPDLPYCSEDWLTILVEAGLPMHMTSEHLVKAAKSLSWCAARNVHSKVHPDVACAAYYFCLASLSGEVSDGDAARLQQAVQHMRPVHQQVGTAVRAALGTIASRQASIAAIRAAASRALGNVLAPPLPSHSAPDAEHSFGVPVTIIAKTWQALGRDKASTVTLPSHACQISTVACARAVTELSCVPALMPSLSGHVYEPPYTCAALRSRVVHRDYVPVIIGDVAQQPLLVRFRDAVRVKDAHLAWSVLPTIPPSLDVPPLPLTGAGAQPGGEAGQAQSLPGVLGCSSPPAKAIVLRHIRQVFTPGPSVPTLPPCWRVYSDLWRFRDSPLSAMTSILAWLDSSEGWGSLTEAEKQAFAHLPIIPVGHSCFIPSRAFLRIDTPVFPLLAEVPRPLAAYERVLLALGVRQTVTGTILHETLVDTYERSCGLLLEPNELQAAISAANTLAILQASGGPAVPAVPIPDQTGVMRPAFECAYPDDAWLAGRLASMGSSSLDVFIVHPGLAKSTCTVLGVQPVSQRIKEGVAAVQEVQDAGWLQSIDSAIHTVLQTPHVAQLLKPSSRRATVAPVVHIVDTCAVCLYVRGSAGDYTIVPGSEQHPAAYPDISDAGTTVYVSRQACSSAGLDLAAGVARGVAEAIHTSAGYSINEGLLAAQIRRSVTPLTPRAPSLPQSASIDTDPASAMRVKVLSAQEEVLLGRGKAGCLVERMDQESARTVPTRTLTRGEIVCVPPGTQGVAHAMYGVVDNVLSTAEQLLCRVMVTCGQEVGSLTLDAGQVQVFSTAEDSAARLGLARQLFDARSRLPSRHNAAAASAGTQASTEGHAAPSAEAPRPARDARQAEEEVAQAMGSLLSRLGVAGGAARSDTDPVVLARLTTLRAQASEATAKAAALDAELVRLRAELQSARSARVCNICMTNEVDSVLVPCGHAICSSCARGLQQPACPWDRQGVTSLMPLYLP